MKKLCALACFNTESSTTLCLRGAEADARGEKQKTALHPAEMNMDVVRTLPEAGADPDLQDKDDCWPYYFAFYGSMPREFAGLHIKYGANLMLYPDK